MTSVYKGWTPVVGQRLSFSIVGETEYPSPSICVNVADETDRFLVVYQKRYLSDRPIPFPIPDTVKNFFTKLLFSTDGMFWFVCIANAHNGLNNSSSEMSGKIFIYADKNLWRHGIEPHIKKAQDVLSRFQYRRDETLSEYVQKSVDEHLHTPKSDYLYCVDFTLQRDGIATLTKIGNDELLSTGTLYKDYKENLLSDSNKIEEMVKQSYFFLKDLAHTHQHHHYRTDTITDLIPYHDNDVNWMGSTLRGLYKKVLEYKRVIDKKDGIYHASQGILAYTDSFRQIAKSHLSDSEYKTLPLRNHENIRQSIQASQAQCSLDNQKSAETKQVYINVLFTIAGLMIALASLASLDDNIQINIADTYVERLLSMLIEYPLGLLTIAVYMTVFWVMISGKFRWRGAAVMDTVRMLLPLRRNVSAMLLFVIASGIAFLTLTIVGLIEPAISMLSNLFGLQ